MSGYNEATAAWESLKLTQLSKDKKFYLPLRRYIAGLAAEANFPAPQVVAGELRLNTVKDSAMQIIENPVFPIARMKYENPLCSLFAIYVHLPKLNVAGSIPVSPSGLLSGDNEKSC
ncbi:MAG: hypothetical protein WCF30_17150 [Terracidiphilus sp.]